MFRVGSILGRVYKDYYIIANPNLKLGLICKIEQILIWLNLNTYILATLSFDDISLNNEHVPLKVQFNGMHLLFDAHSESNKYKVQQPKLS